MKKILIGICGIGNGHLNRQICVINELKSKGFEVLAATSIDKVSVIKKKCNIDVLPIIIPWIVCDKNGVNFKDTLEKYCLSTQDRFKNFLEFSIAVEKYFNGKPDLVITDYEPNVAEYAYASNLKLITMEQQSKFLYLENIEINDFSEKIDNIQLNGIEFFILLNNPNKPTYLNEDGSFRYQPDNKIKEIMIGMDTACIALGINNYANDIRDSKGDWQPDNSLNTLTDGIFGYVKEGTKDNTIDFIWISGYLDEDTGYSINEILDYICTQFEVKNLYREINNEKFPVIKDNLNDINYDI